MDERSLRTLLGAIATYKGVEGLVLGAGLLAVPLLVAGGASRLVRAQWAWWSLAVASLVTALGPLYKNHLAMLFWVSLACAVFPEPDQRRFVLRAQLSIVYAFAALSKVWPAWLEGDVLVEQTWIAPLLADPLVDLLAWATIAVEAVLAVAVWRRGQVWWWLAVAVHVSFVLFVWMDLLETVRLVVFGALMVGVWSYARPDDTPGGGDLTPVGSGGADPATGRSIRRSGTRRRS